MLGLCLLVTWMNPTSATSSVAVIIEANETGPVIGSPQDYVVRHGPSARLDSVMAEFTMLTTSLTSLQQLIASDDLLVVIALEDLWETNAPLFTNIDPEAPRCPRMFILGSFLLDPKRSSCLRTATIAHEAQHAIDFVTGTMPPVTGATAIENPGQAFDILEVETRGFMVQLSFMKSHTCLKENEYGRVFERGGLPALRELIARTYALDRVPGTNQRVLKHYCRWTPPSTLIDLSQ